MRKYLHGLQFDRTAGIDDMQRTRAVATEDTVIGAMAVAVQHHVGSAECAGQELAAIPMLVADTPAAPAGWARALATPVAGVGYDHLSFMLYSTIMAGYASSWIDQAGARYLLYASALRARACFGRSAGASLGITGPGALGDEPFYADIEHMIDDIAWLRAAGIDDLALHGLEGIVSRGPERWLRSFTTARAAPGPPPRVLSAEVIFAAAIASSGPLAWMSRVSAQSRALARHLNFRRVG